MIVLKIIRQYPSPPDTMIHMRREVFGVRLKTHRGFGPCVWALLPFGGIYMRYDDYIDTYIEIHMKYKPLWPV